MNIRDYFRIRSKRQSKKEKLIFYLRLTIRPVSQRIWLTWFFFLSSSTFLLSLHVLFFLLPFVFLHTTFKCLEKLFSSSVLSFFARASLRCCFVVKFTLFYYTWQTWRNDKKSPPSMKKWLHEQKIVSDEHTMCLLIALYSTARVYARWRNISQEIHLYRMHRQYFQSD